MPQTPMMDHTVKTGFISLIGRPNAGKSTLLNRILGEKIAITSDKPQTTRNRILGIHTTPSVQYVFIDTPGMHTPRSRLNRGMVDIAHSALSGVDLVVLVADATLPPDQELVATILAAASTPILLVLNKIDLLPDKSTLLQTISHWSALHSFVAVIPLSAQDGDGVHGLLDVVAMHLPPGHFLFPDDILTDSPERFVVAELIREKIFRLTRDEIPYATAVVIEAFTERPTGVVAINAAILLEREAQKKIIIGKKGDMLKRIGSQARHDIERLLDTRVYLELFVKVEENWSERPSKLRELGYE